MPETKKITLAITGASGVQYSLRLLQCLGLAKAEVHLLLSDAAREVFSAEMDYKISHGDEHAFFVEHSGIAPSQLHFYHGKDWYSPVASGSAHMDAMVICPCSGGTLASIAQGASHNLIDRAAAVMLKERRSLIVVPRETPVSSIQLENMLKLSQLGVQILPASPGFYQQPKTIDDLIDFVVARILDQLHISQTLLTPWGSPKN